MVNLIDMQQVTESMPLSQITGDNLPHRQHHCKRTHGGDCRIWHRLTNMVIISKGMGIMDHITGIRGRWILEHESESE